MLQISTDENEIKIGIKRRNKGKIRLKKLESSRIGSTYSHTINRDTARKQPYYIEWQISYYITPEEVSNYPSMLLINKRIRLPHGEEEVYPAELFGILHLAWEKKIIEREEIDELIRWVASVREEDFLDKSLLKHNIREKYDIQIRDLKFKTAVLELPYCVLENEDGSWIEIIMQKQQYAYSFQPMVYLCLPHTALQEENDYVWWRISKQNSSSVINTLKVFSLASEKHKEDVYTIIKELFSG